MARLAGGFSSPSTVRYYFDQWSRVPGGAKRSLLEQALKKSGGARTQEQRTAALDELLHRGRAKRQRYPDTAQQGYDAGKKVSGIKRALSSNTMAQRFRPSE
jgi:hypothetical protein